MNNLIDRKKTIFEKYLKNISGISFTNREIDIISAIIHSRGEKKIAGMLNISPRTVSCHVHNIMRKLSCSSKEQIIDFIEKSGKIQYFREYYVQSLLRIAFENHLNKVAKQFVREGIKIGIIFENLNSGDSELLSFIKSSLNFANIHSNESEKSQKTKTLYVISNNQSGIESTSDAIGLIFSNNDGILSYDFDNVDFTDINEIHASIFSLIAKILHNADISHIISEFNSESELIRNSWNMNFTDDPAKTNQDIISEKPKAKRFTIFALSFLTIFISLMFLSYKLSGVEPDGKQIISELPIPHERVLLDRAPIIQKISECFEGCCGIKVVALVGSGGAGKTTIARQYARGVKSPIVWEVNAETKESIISSFEQLAYSLDQSPEHQRELEFIKNLKNEEEKNKKLFSLITRNIKDHDGWLIIYNDVNTFKDIRKYFPYDRQVWGNGKVIITTRDNNIGNNNYIPNENVIHVGELSDEEKIGLFTKIMKNDSDDNILEKNYEDFIKKIPPFPLDLSLAAYYIKEEKIDYNEYLNYLSTPNDEFLSVQEIILNEIGEYTKTRYEIVSLSVKQILNEDKDFSSLLFMLSLIDPQDIPKDLLVSYADEFIISKFMHSLRRYSLIHSSTDSSFTIHASTRSILSEYLLKSMNEEKISEKYKEISQKLEDYVLDETVKHNYKSFSLVKHIEMFLSQNNKLFDKITKASLRSKLGVYYFHIANFQKSRLHLEQSLEVYEEIYGREHIKTAWVLARLGVVYRNLGDDSKAKEFLEKALEVSERLNGSEHIETVRIYTYLGSVYRSIGDYKKAEKLLIHAFNTYKEFYGPYNSNTAWVSAYLGCVYKCLGNYRKAKEHLELAFNIYKKYHGLESTSTAWVSARLGNVYYSTGNLKEAKELFDQSLDIYNKYDGGNSLEAAWCYMQLAKIYDSEGKHKEALRLVKEGIGIYNVNLDDSHIIKTWANVHLAEIYINLNELDNAKKILEESLIIYKSHYGQDHVKTAGVMKRLSALYKKDGNLDESEKMAKIASEVFEKYAHAESYSCYEILADIYFKKYYDERNKEDKMKYLELAKKYAGKSMKVASKCFSIDAEVVKRLKEKYDS